jgi:anthranilate/para-aminobenzoate synthase component II
MTLLLFLLDQGNGLDRLMASSNFTYNLVLLLYLNNNDITLIKRDRSLMLAAVLRDHLNQNFGVRSPGPHRSLRTLHVPHDYAILLDTSHTLACPKKHPYR